MLREVEIVIRTDSLVDKMVERSAMIISKIFEYDSLHMTLNVSQRDYNRFSCTSADFLLTVTEK